MSKDKAVVFKIRSKDQYTFLQQTPSQFLERRLATIYGIRSQPIKALDLVKEEMCKEKGFTRDDGQDYYNHCIDVANTLISFGITNSDTICAALLHDIEEDIPEYTGEALRRLFNERVSYLVALLSKKTGVNYKLEKNLKPYLYQILADMEASAIKTADRMHNMMTLQEKSFDSRYRKAIQTEMYFLPFFKTARQLYPRYENLFYAARTQIEPLIFEIKSFHKEMEELKKKMEELEVQNEKLKKEICKNANE